MNESPGYGTKGCRYSVVQYVVLKICIKIKYLFKCASGSGVEHHLAKVGAAGSNPVSRFDIENISKKLLTNKKNRDIISELLLKKLAATNLDN